MILEIILILLIRFILQNQMFGFGTNKIFQDHVVDVNINKFIIREMNYEKNILD
jgi:hypothetical protein